MRISHQESGCRGKTSSALHPVRLFGTGKCPTEMSVDSVPPLHCTAVGVCAVAGGQRAGSEIETRCDLDVLITTKKRMFSYRELVQTWQEDHREARKADKLSLLLQKIDLAGLLREGMLLWESITEMHQAFLESVSSGETEPDLTFEQQIWSLYQQWLQHTADLKTILLWFTEQHVEVEHTESFLECLQDATEQLAHSTKPDVAIKSFIRFQSQPNH